MLHQEYFVLLSADEHLSMFKVVDLKAILSKSALPISGKKQELVDRIVSTQDEQSIAKYCGEPMYKISHKVEQFIEEHKDCIKVHQYKAQYNVDWNCYISHKRPKQRFNDVIWSIMNERIMSDAHHCGRFEYSCMYSILKEEGKRKDALQMLLRLLYIDLSGVCGDSAIALYQLGSHSKSELKDDYDIVIYPSFDFYRQVKDYKDVFDDSYIERLYLHQPLPVQICSRTLFTQIVDSLLNDSFDEESTNSKQKKSFTSG